MENLKKSTWTRVLCYILIPIFLIILILSVLNVVITSEYGDFNKNQEFVQTENFAMNYLYSIVTDIEYIKEYEKSNKSQSYGKYAEIEESDYSEGRIYYESRNYNDTYIYNNIQYIIINKETNELYTNIRTKNYIQDIEDMKTKDIYWVYEDGNISTNIELMNQDNAKYLISDYQSMEEMQGYKVYTSFDMQALNSTNVFYIQQEVYNLFKGHENAPVYLIPISAICLIAMIIYLCISIGHEKGKEGIVLNGIDKFPYEILFTIISMIIGIVLSIGIAGIEVQIPQKMVISLFLLSYLGSYASGMVLFVTTVKRIKAKQFWKTFLIYKIYAWIKRSLKKSINAITDKTNSNRKIAILYWSFIIITSILISLSGSFFGFLLLIAFWILVFYEILQYNKKLKQIQDALMDIYQGKPDVHLDEEVLKGTLGKMAKYINDIAGGFHNAIEQSLKSERMKTELITNVSHDIKTPLTSIINYVDLLKKENIQDAKIEQYIAILDKKSQRLKKLIEDLVEASKVSSGNLKLNMEDINIKELIQQITGEFEDKFEKKNLKIDMNLAKESMIVKADTRYMYRIVENLFSNITKYALENTRVYIELKKYNERIYLTIKNISKDRLNITSEELMQRFVRGDKSRYTEGSGLGLSIAKSLTELQGGNFNIQIDGDLFKVEIIW